LTQTFNFDTDSSTFVQKTLSYGSSSCQSQLEYNITYGGSYDLGSDTLQNWTGISYSPSWFSVTVAGSGQQYALNQSSIGTCVSDLLIYLNTNCPCNGTWQGGVTRTITRSQCPAGSCNDTWIFNTSNQYGNIQKVENATELYLLITQTQYDQNAGHDETTVLFSEKPGCGIGCKSCTITPSSYTNCTSCCATKADPEADGTCKCQYGKTSGSTNFTLQCKSSAATMTTASNMAFLVVAILLKFLAL
jgi:hypothetical protein